VKFFRVLAAFESVPPMIGDLAYTMVEIRVLTEIWTGQKCPYPRQQGPYGLILDYLT